MEQSPNSYLNKPKFLIYAGIAFSLLLIYFAFVLANSRSSWYGRATSNTSTTGFSRENSYIFASPISASADGNSIIRVTVFLLNNQGLGVQAQKVNLRVQGGTLRIKEVQGTTDSLGRAIFDTTSGSPQSYTVTAESSGITLSQTVSIAFQ